MGGCFSYRLKLVRESDEFPNAQALSRKLTPFSFISMEKATNNFDPSGEIRRDGFSKSYKGILDDGSQVEVVVQTNEYIEFTSVINIMSGVKHKNVVELIGYCIEGSHRILVHEFVGEKSLDQLLFSDIVLLDWPTRVSVCQGIALGLDYLHNAISPRVVHRDIKPSNILMDCNFNPKIVGFEVSCLLEEGVSHHSGNLVGTMGYIDPEVIGTNKFSEKTDAYAFGVTLLEIINGNRNLPCLDRETLTWLAWELKETGRISEFVDQKLSEFSEEELTRIVTVALACVQRSSNLRLSMSEVRVMLSDRQDYGNMVLTAPDILVSQQQQMSSDSEVSFLVDDEQCR